MPKNQRSRNPESRRELLKLLGAGAAVSAGIACSREPAVTLPAAEAPQRWDREVDVVVVGTGAAGTPAAIEAARTGAKVLRLEKVAVVGGNMSHSQGIIYLGGGTALQQKHGFKDTVEGMFTYLSAFMAPWEDPAFLRFYCENAAAHFDWLVSQGVPFGEAFTARKVVNPLGGGGGLSYCGNEPNYPYDGLTPPVPRAHNVVGYGAGMSRALQDMADKEPNLSTEVNAPVTNLITDDHGRVIGVIAKIKGREQRVLARRGVILASGGYEMNPDMLRQTKAAQYPLVPMGSSYRGNTGDGIRLAASLGARLRDMDHTFSTPFVYPPQERVAAILVNKVGRRFANEASYGAVLGDEIVEHQSNVAWLIMDSTIAAEVNAVGTDGSMPLSQTASAPTIEALAQKLGLPAEALVAEVEFYNRHAAKGVDPLFHKHTSFLKPLRKAPFLAFNFTEFMPFLTTGHVEIDINAQVLNQYGQPIPGLYAAGQNGAGIGRRFYNSGIRLGEASFFGRIAGRTAARAAPWTGATSRVVPSSVTGEAGALPGPAIEVASIEAGEALYKSKGCNTCHSTDGSKTVGPSFKGLWGKTEKTDKGDVTVDLAYLTESVLNPAARVVDGFPAAMPPQQLSEVEIKSLSLLLETLK